MIGRWIQHPHRGILWQCSSLGGSRTELHQVLEWIFKFYFLNRIWGLMHSSCCGKITSSEKVCSKTALFLQTANLYLGNEDHVPKVAQAIFKQKDTWGHIFIAQIDSVKLGIIEAAIGWGYVTQKLRADYPNCSFKYMESWIVLNPKLGSVLKLSKGCYCELH